MLDRLKLTLEAHGIPCELHDNRLHATATSLVLEPRVFDGPPTKTSVMVQFDVIAYANIIGSRYINESFAGIGATREEAEKNAFSKFLLGTLHVLLTALIDHDCKGNPAEHLAWGNGEKAWSVCDGPLLTVGPWSDNDTYKSFYAELENLFLRTISRDTHWLRVFVSSFDDQQAPIEVLLDNEPWPEATELAKEFNWKLSKQYCSVRHFFVAIPSDGG
jgi:Family of unknown function (DUF6348)